MRIEIFVELPKSVEALERDVERAFRNHRRVNRFRHDFVCLFVDDDGRVSRGVVHARDVARVPRRHQTSSSRRISATASANAFRNRLLVDLLRRERRERDVRAHRVLFGGDLLRRKSRKSERRRRRGNARRRERIGAHDFGLRMRLARKNEGAKRENAAHDEVSIIRA